MNPPPDFGFWLHLLGGLAGEAALLIALVALAARRAVARRQRPAAGPIWRVAAAAPDAGPATGERR
jgi:hypothetical protein